MATKQLLLLSGDVETNPGWQGVIDQTGYYLQDLARSVHQGLNMSVAHIYIRSLRNKVDEIKILLHTAAVLTFLRLLKLTWIGKFPIDNSRLITTRLSEGTETLTPSAVDVYSTSPIIYAQQG